MHFQWDPLKAARNVRKHDVPFEEAASAFRDPLGVVFPDPDHSVSERRRILVGHSTRQRLLLVVFVEKDEDTLRLISARPATRRERKRHEEGIGN